MATDRMNTVIQHIRQSVRFQDEAAWTDGQLLTHFIEHNDESAFASLVRRHGAMVMGVCLRVARNQHDAEDAFQATFLILVRKAASIGSRELIANWLYGVAYHTALKAKAVNMKRRIREKQVTELPEPALAEGSGNDDLKALIDQELNRLPTKYRIPILLCELEGRSRKEAAEIIGCPEGSLSSRLARAKTMLAKRLARHGLAVSGGSLSAALAQNAASACVPPSIAAVTIKTATLVAAGQATVGMISPKVAALMEGVLKVMLLSKLNIGAIWLFVGLIAFGAGLFIYQGATAQPGTLERVAEGMPQLPQEAKQKKAQPDDDVENDANALQGKWAIESLIYDGDEPPAEMVNAMVLIVKGDKMTFKPGLGIDATEQGKIKFNLDNDPTEVQFKLRVSNPKQIQVTATDPGAKERSMTGIYKLSGDKLTVCFGEETDGKTPDEFIAKKGSKQTLWVANRQPHKENVDPPKNNVNRVDEEKLQGAWQLITSTEDGKDVPRDLVKQVQIKFHRGKMTFTPPLEFHETLVEGEKDKHGKFKLGEGDFEMTFHLDPTTKPKSIDLVLPEDIGKRLVIKGIYSLEDDRLSVCARLGDRPTDLTCQTGSKRVLYVMERKKPTPDTQKKDASKVDQEKLQGAWRVVSAERYGILWKNVDGEFVIQDKRPMAFPISPEYPNQVVFSGRQCSQEIPQGETSMLVVKDTFTLNAESKPKWITLTGKDGVIIYGIYSLDRDELRLCWQYGQRRNLRPTDFDTMKKIDRDDDTEVWVLKRPGPDAEKKAVQKDESKAVPIQQSWDGILPNRNLIKESPPEGFVVEAESWAKMWKAWRGKEKLPALDFDKQIALIFTVPGPNKISAPELRIDGSGNIRVPLPVSTLLPDDGRIGYKIVIIGRAGVKSVGGRSIIKLPQGQSPSL